MAGGFFDKQFIQSHLYDLFADSNYYKGIYVCQNPDCDFLKEWDGSLSEFVSCNKSSCKGIMRLLVVSNSNFDEIMNQRFQ